MTAKQIATIKTTSRELQHTRNTLIGLAFAVLKDFTRARTATADLLTFHRWAQRLDNTIPDHAVTRSGKPGYRDHPTYQALLFMLRIAARDHGSHPYKDTTWDRGNCQTCGSGKGDHLYREVKR